MMKRLRKWWLEYKLKRQYYKVKRSERAILELIYEYEQVNHNTGSPILLKMLQKNRETLLKFKDKPYYSEKILI